MTDAPVLTIVVLALGPKLTDIDYVTRLVMRFLVPPTIDAAVYLDLQRVVDVFGATRTWTVRAMDEAAARGRLEIVKWLHENRSEGCSADAFAGAVANNHLDVLYWLYKRYNDRCNLTQALSAAAGAGNLKAVKFFQAKCWPTDTSGWGRYVYADYEAVLGIAASNGHVKVVQCLLAKHWLRNRAAIGTYGTASVIVELCRWPRPQGYPVLFNEGTLARSRALENAAVGGHVAVITALLGYTRHCRVATFVPALEKAAGSGQMEAVAKLLPVCRGIGTTIALFVAVVNGHRDVAEFLVRHFLSSAGLSAVNQAKADSYERHQVALIKSTPYDQLSCQAQGAFRSCLALAATRGSEQIVGVLIGRFSSAPESDLGFALKGVVQDSHYGVVRILLDEFKARRLPAPFASVKPLAANDPNMMKLLASYRDEYALPESVCQRESFKKQRIS